MTMMGSRINVSKGRVVMRKVIFLMVAVLSSAAFAEDHSGGGALTDAAARYFAYFFGLGLAVFSGTKAQSHAAAVALEGIARNPSAADKLQAPMILALALMESLVIFMLISPFVAGDALK